MILHLNSRKDFVLSFIYRPVDFRFGDWHLCKSPSLPTLLYLSFLTHSLYCSKIKSVNVWNAYILTYNFFLSSKKLLGDKDVCLGRWRGGVLQSLAVLSHFLPNLLRSKDRACSVALRDALCHLVESSWKRTVRGLSDCSARSLPEAFSAHLMSRAQCRPPAVMSNLTALGPSWRSFFNVKMSLRWETPILLAAGWIRVTRRHPHSGPFCSALANAQRSPPTSEQAARTRVCALLPISERQT